jgi:capsular polysaccharide biosynthesis protein
MSQQPMSLRRAMRALRRHKVTVGVAVGIGLLVGAGYGSINPPARSATSLVVMPAVQNLDISTDMVVAASDPVLAGAQPNITPAISLAKLRDQVTAANPSGNVISITATASTGAGAIAIANAVANSYVGYLASSQSPVGRVNAHLLESATTAAGPDPLAHRLVYGGVGALIGLVIGAIAALVIGRGDRKLRARDEIANAIGVPVLASLPVNRPGSAPDWAKLLDSYQPGVVHAWRMRKALQQLSLSGVNVLNGSRDKGPSSLGVLSLASDPGALALGPQLAVYAASLGIPTTLVIGPAASDGNAALTLRTACSQWAQGPSGRQGNLRVTVAREDGTADVPRGTMLAVVVAIVDGERPLLDTMMPTSATVLGVSAGVATAEQLARTAISAAADDREVAGLLVANPEPGDHTTGRIPQLTRPASRMPTRFTGATMEARR